MGNRSIWIRLVLAIAAGMGIALLLPTKFGYLSWFAFAPLLLALWSDSGKHRAWKGFGLAYLAGVICNALQLSWLTTVSPLGAVILPLALSIYWGIFGAFAATLGHPGETKLSFPASLRITFINAAVWALIEWLRGWLFTGFGWNGLGVSFHENLLFAQAADILGVVGLSLLVVWIAGLIVLTHKRRPGPSVLAILGIIAAVLGYGQFRIHQEKSLPTTPLKALLVQLNIPQEAAQVLWSSLETHVAYETDTLAALEKTKAAGDFPDWVIWPESALTGRILRTPDGKWGAYEENLHTISNIREAGDFTLIYGANELEAVEDGQGLIRKEGGAAYNSLAIQSVDDQLQTFRKHHLVAFGEFIPFVDSLPFLKKIYEQQAGVEYGGAFTPGDSFEPLTATAAGKTIGIIPSVCFEDTVPRLPRRFLRPGPQVIVNVTNDGWFKESIGAAQHFANARFRAIELRRPMIRCSNTGVTATLTGSGKSRVLVDQTGSHFTRGSMLATLDIPIHPPGSLYALIGDWGVIATGIGAILWCFIRRPFPGRQ